MFSCEYSPNVEAVKEKGKCGCLISSIKPHNDKNQAHGYWEVYHDKDNLWFKGVFKNDERIGYVENHTSPEPDHYKKLRSTMF